MVELILLALVGLVIVAGAAYDAATLTIPNWISLALIGLFPFVALAAGLTLGEAGLHATVGLGALAVGIALFAGGLIGGGDAKLFAAVALYMGVGWVGSYVVAVVIAGGVVACMLLLVRWVASTGITVQFAWLQRLISGAGSIPYGIAIAAGGLLVLPTTHLFALATGTQ